MEQELKDVQDALAILGAIRTTLAAGPTPIWLKAHNAFLYLEKQQDQIVDVIYGDILRGDTISELEAAVGRLQPIRVQVETFRCEIERGDTGNQNAVPCGEPYARLCVNCETLICSRCAKETLCDSGDRPTEHQFSEN